MKLIRLYKEFEGSIDGNTALFDNNFQGDLVLEPQSQIALHNIAIDSINPGFTVDSENAGFAWGVVPSSDPTNENIIEMPLGIITQDNVKEFAISWSRKLNDSAGFEQATEGFTFGSYYYGLQWLVTVDRKWNLTANWSQFVLVTDSVSVGLDAAVSNQIGFGIDAPNNRVSIQSTSVDFVTADYTSAIYGLTDSPIATGNASTRCQLDRLKQHTGETDPEKNGFLMGLTQKIITTSTNAGTALSPGDSAVNFAIRATDFGSGIKYYAVIFGTLYGPATGITPNYTEGSADNDFLEIVYNGNEYCYNIWQYNSTTEKVEQYDLLADPGIDRNNPAPVNFIDRIPFMVFNAGNDDVKVNNFCFTPDPYKVPNTSDLPVIFQNFADAELAPPIQNLDKRETALKFESTELANYLGFDANYVGPVISRDPINVTITSKTTFNPLYYTDGFLVELKDIYLESYDGLKEQRKNILNFLTLEDKTGQMNWRANYPLFINLNNKDPLLLRNIRAEILYADYSKLRIQSDGYMTLLVKGPNEN